MSQILTKEECIGAPDRWRANAERLRNKKRKEYAVPKVCPEALRKLAVLEQAEKDYSSPHVETSGSIPNAFYEADFLLYPPQSWAGENPYLNKEHLHFDDTIIGIVRSFHSDRTLEQEPKEALNLRKVYQMYKYLPCFNAQLISNELGISKTQSYLYLKLARMANTLLAVTTDKTMPIIPNYSDRDTKNYSRYKSKNKEAPYSKKIWWLMTRRYAA